MSDSERIETNELIEMLRGYSLGLRATGNIAGANIVNLAAERLEELEKLVDDLFTHC